MSALGTSPAPPLVSLIFANTLPTAVARAAIATAVNAVICAVVMKASVSIVVSGRVECARCLKTCSGDLQERLAAVEYHSPPGMKTLVAGAAALALLASVVAQAQDKTATPRAVATSIAEPIHVDGVLDEPAWSRAVPIGPLVQSDPRQGAPASEDTEVRVLFDATTLYLGIAGRDRDAKAIVPTH